MSLYDGPSSGSTPAGAADLHNNPNPHNDGEKLGSTSDVRSSQYPSGSSVSGSVGNPTLSGYYMNLPPNPENPFQSGQGIGEMSSVDDGPTAYMTSGLAALYVEQRGNMSGGYGNAPDPNSADRYQESIRVDTAQNDQFVPKGQRS